ncbi:MAG TPA: hypothetical protein PK324_17515, partial [Nocardioides sp.]|nr:hypothetical protein [Nocardioides sp.]
GRAGDAEAAALLAGVLDNPDLADQVREPHTEEVRGGQAADQGGDPDGDDQLADLPASGGGECW